MARFVDTLSLFQPPPPANSKLSKPAAQYKIPQRRSLPAKKQTIIYTPKKPIPSTGHPVVAEPPPEDCLNFWPVLARDQVVGTNQTGNGFWNCITKKYIIAIPDPLQTPVGLKSHWCTLQGAINKFSACVKQIEHHPQKGFCAYCLLRNPGQRSEVERVHHEPPEQIGLPKAKAPGHNYHHCRFVGTP
ncbi:hypothetical protein PCANC_00919 [Puccinia coronata f. sp. avenae]|uniref:No apical meristem-associated C-terminal domain-containing protein n=1 Tax=Puccinia coronata f. sp. avenae TaxID=200324 RepID=A0A2N5W6M5_9BASI|nr:hypothetical protein PCANC_00919 [Puccinia coronata f. sp. avenae]